MQVAEQEEVTVLEKVRTNIAAARADRLNTAAGYLENRESLDIAIRRFENQLQVAAIQKQDCVKSAKALSAAYLGLEMPSSIIAELADRTRQINSFDSRIKEINGTIADLTENRADAEAQYQLAEQAVVDIQKELRQVDQRMAEIRGF